MVHGAGIVHHENDMRSHRGLKEIAVVGFDDSPAAALPQVDLASYNHDGARQGAEATRLLLSRIEGDTKPQRILIAGSLMIRGSARKPRVQKT